MPEDKKDNLDEIVALLRYAYKNNGWAYMYDNYKLGRKIFKYITIKFDTRDCSVWLIDFHDDTGKNNKRFSIESKDDIQEIYKWLDATKKEKKDD